MFGAILLSVLYQQALEIYLLYYLLMSGKNIYHTVGVDPT